MWVFLWIFSFISTAIATPSGAEVALVLDSSGSMGSGNQITITDPNTGTSRTINVVANDPDRSSILGALVIEGLLRGGTDGYQVYFMPNDPNDPAPTTNSKNDIFNLQFSTNTNVASPLKQSIQQLNRSQKKDKTIIFLTDGTPSDIKQPYNLEGLIPKNRDFRDFLAPGAPR